MCLGTEDIVGNMEYSKDRSSNYGKSLIEDCQEIFTVPEISFK